MRSCRLGGCTGIASRAACFCSPPSPLSKGKTKLETISLLHRLRHSYCYDGKFAEVASF